MLKGGYFSERVSEMNVVARGDDYTVVGSSRAERIGFRLAFGRIPDPVWLDASGHAKASVVTPLAGATSLKARTGTYNMVLAFRNDIKIHADRLRHISRVIADNEPDANFYYKVSTSTDGATYNDVTTAGRRLICRLRRRS